MTLFSLKNASSVTSDPFALWMCCLVLRCLVLLWIDEVSRSALSLPDHGALLSEFLSIDAAVRPSFISVSRAKCGKQDSCRDGVAAKGRGLSIAIACVRGASATQPPRLVYSFDSASIAVH